MPHAVDPVVVRLADGREVKFLLTMGGLKRIRERFGWKNIPELALGIQEDPERAVAVMAEAIIPKGAIAEADLVELLPASLSQLFAVTAELLGASLPTVPPAAGPSPTM